MHDNLVHRFLLKPIAVTHPFAHRSPLVIIFISTTRCVGDPQAVTVNNSLRAIDIAQVDNSTDLKTSDFIQCPPRSRKEDRELFEALLVVAAYGAPDPMLA